MRRLVQIVGVYAAPMSDASIVLLGEPDNTTRVLPIFIGDAEAQAIAIALAGIDLPRPGTHDLMLSALGELDAHVGSVTVTELRDGAFLAEVTLEHEDDIRILDARPSDGIALAVRSGASLYAEESVLDEASVDVEHDADEPFDEAEIESIVADFRDVLATAEPEDFEEPPSAPGE